MPEKTYTHRNSSTKPPAEMGYYWLKAPSLEEPELVSVQKHPTSPDYIDIWWFGNEVEETILMVDEKYLWWGPVEPPEMPKPKKPGMTGSELISKATTKEKATVESTITSPIDHYAAKMIAGGMSGIRVIVSKGKVNNWHAYIVLLGVKGREEKRVLETNHCNNYMAALAELEENVMRDLKR